MRPFSELCLDYNVSTFAPEVFSSHDSARYPSLSILLWSVAFGTGHISVKNTLDL